MRSGKCPFCLELVTYRYRGHSMGDPERYREKDEIIKWQENDPIEIYNKYLIKEKIATKANLTKIEKGVEAEVEAAVEFAENSTAPAPEEMVTDIYAEGK